MESVEGSDYVLRLRDLTVPSNPEETWTVPGDALPLSLDVGQMFRLVIRRGAHFVPDRRRYWTKRQLDRAKRRAVILRAKLVEESACSSV